MMNFSRAFKYGIKMSKSPPPSSLLRIEHVEGNALPSTPGHSPTPPSPPPPPRLDSDRRPTVCAAASAGNMRPN